MSKFHQSNIHPIGLVLKVMDLVQGKKFYKEVMGFKILKEGKDRVYLTADGKNPMVTLVRPENPIEKVPRRTGLYHFAILLPDKVHLGLFLKHLRKLDYPIIGGSNHGVSQAIYLEDLDKNGIEVYTDLDSRDWKRVDDSIEMVTLPLDYPSLINSTGEKEWEGMPENTILGHIHLHVKDLEEAKRFYLDGLGMDLISEMGNSAVFTSSAGYHHHIAFNIWNGKGAKPLDANNVGMDYYILEFPHRHSLEGKAEDLKKLGYKVYERDGMVFVHDPSENRILMTSK